MTARARGIEYGTVVSTTRARDKKGYGGGVGFGGVGGQRTIIDPVPGQRVEQSPFEHLSWTQLGVVDWQRKRRIRLEQEG